MAAALIPEIWIVRHCIVRPAVVGQTGVQCCGDEHISYF
ncbi:hypothetical protein SKA53_08141 [Yoonia vestfoldensis SKA53]|uniref:Uncharacterized protein n=1 Tax=Yoonia vestfoldensis SKA53 TaxID=314232 RepID=A3V744_9RHOB|nr:hypothetical protein SKA53_08141 [Yoonia vestfoldensis SKA53]